MDRIFGITFKRSLCALFLSLCFIQAHEPAQARPVEASIAPSPVTALIGVTKEEVSCVIGGGSNKMLVDGKTAAASLSHKQAFSLMSLGGPVQNVFTVGLPKPLSGGEECSDQFEQELTFIPGTLTNDMVALTGSKAQSTRFLPKTLQIRPADYKPAVEIVDAYLRGEGLKDPVVKIKQAIEVDLDGDGSLELVINAVNSERGDTKKGEYAAILVKSKTADTIALSANISLEDADSPSVLWENIIVSIVDMDLDGLFEIVLYGWFLEGDGWEVYEFDGSVRKPALICGCGG